jgi:type IV pilus assembly protein PilQ
VTDIPQVISAVENLIAKLDVPEPQVEIEARVVVATRSFSRTIGNQLFLSATQSRRGQLGPGAIFDSSGQTLQQTPIRNDRATMTGSNVDNQGRDLPQNNVAPGFIGQPASRAVQGTLSGAAASTFALTTGALGTTLLASAISLSEGKGLLKTIATPRVTVQNNTPADITSGRQIAVQTEVNNTITTNFITAALRLNVTPQIVDEGNVLLRIVVENNDVDLSIRTLGGVPAITTQRAETLVLVPDGGTTILGGINVDSENTVVGRVPGIANVPFLGELFKRRDLGRRSQELLFFVTPRIYRSETLGVQTAPTGLAPAPSVVSGPEQAVPQSGGER